MANRPETFLWEEERDAVSIASYFGENVFGDEAMKKYLPEAAYQSVKEANLSGKIDEK